MNGPKSSPIKTREANRIRVAFYESQDRYLALAAELHRILDQDVRFPRNAVYAVKHRLKGHQRLLEKIDDLNARRRAGSPKVDHTNFANRIDDLLGVRVVVLRLSDLGKVRQYLDSLVTEHRLQIVNGPVEKTTFLVRPGSEPLAGGMAGTLDMQYSGYSSVHYVVKLGRALEAPLDLAGLKAELQLRTIFEEAWGEIDHKYRYERVRSGERIPEFVESGFSDLGLYLQAAARQADHLCEMLERPAVDQAHAELHGGEPQHVPKAAKRSRRPKAKVRSTVAQLARVFQGRLGFAPNKLTLAYALGRLEEYRVRTGGRLRVENLPAMLTEDVLRRFEEIYETTTGQRAFDGSTGDRELDAVRLVDFTLATSVQAREIAEAGLRAALRSSTQAEMSGAKGVAGTEGSAQTVVVKLEGTEDALRRFVEAVAGEDGVKASSSEYRRDEAKYRVELAVTRQIPYHVIERLAHRAGAAVHGVVRKQVRIPGGARTPA